MRGLLSVKDEVKDEYIDRFFDAYWLLNIDLNDEKNITNVLNELKVDSVNFYENIKKQETKELLTKLTQEAFDKKIFGAPTFVVNNKIFWGQDRLDYALDEYKN